MNTIIVTESDRIKIDEYKYDQYFDNFIFNDFRIIQDWKDSKVIYKVYITENIHKVHYRMIEGSSYKDCEFSFAVNEGSITFVKAPIGDYVLEIKEYLKVSRKNLSTNEMAELILKIFGLEATFIVSLKQYIMNESYKRTTITKDCKIRECIDNEVTNKTKTTVINKRSNVQYLLDDMVRYVSHNHRKLNITCECWSVRGHFRHYKNGKVIWISSYEKGEKRNTNSDVRDKYYKI